MSALLVFLTGGVCGLVLGVTSCAVLLRLRERAVTKRALRLFAAMNEDDRKRSVIAGVRERTGA